MLDKDTVVVNKKFLEESVIIAKYVNSLAEKYSSKIARERTDVYLKACETYLRKMEDK